jgi:hypothetical protein
MSEATIVYYAEKFFPHLLPRFGRLAVLAVLHQSK